MDCFIKKIFEGKSDDMVHSQFIKFGKGKFENRAMIKAKNSSGSFTIATTYEYAKDIVWYLAEKLGKDKTKVTGALISMLNLEKEFEFQDRKMAMGVKKYMIDKEMSGEEILALCKKIEKAFFALSFSGAGTELSIQIKSPKSAKGASSSKKKSDDVKINFIKIKTNDKELIKNLIFDKEAENFNKIEIRQDILVNDIIMPKTDEKDFAIIREMAKRKGKIIRHLNIDGKRVDREVEFEV